MTERLCVGIVFAAHGVKGQIRIKSFTADPGDLTRYGPLTTETGERWRLQGVSVGVKGVVTAKIDAINDRNQAEAAKGVKLYVERNALPAADEEEFYVSDLIGLEARSVGGEKLGTVSAVFDFGAGDVIEVKGEGSELLLPFTKRNVPVVDLAAGMVIVDPPEWTGGEEEEEVSPHGD